MRERFLADTTALVLRRVAAVRQLLTPLLVERAVAICGVVELELGRGAKNRSDHDEFGELCSGLPRTPMTDAVFRRAFEVQAALASRGHHRMSVQDLLIAAAAEQAGLAVLHYDRDFERIAEVTGQPHRWVAPRGSL